MADIRQILAQRIFARAQQFARGELTPSPADIKFARRLSAYADAANDATKRLDEIAREAGRAVRDARRSDGKR